MKISKSLATKLCAFVSATALATTAVVAFPNISKAALTDSSLETQHGDNLGKGPEASIELQTDPQTVKPGDSAVAKVKLAGEVPYPESGTWRYGKSDATAVIFEMQIDRRLIVQNADQLSFNWGGWTTSRT